MIYDSWKEIVGSESCQGYKTFTDYKHNFRFVDKIYDPTGIYLKMLKTEYLILSSLSSLSNVIKVYSYNEYDTYAYFEYERLLSTLEFNYKNASESKRRFYVDAARDIVATLWSNGIVHGNLRAYNFKIRINQLVLEGFNYAQRKPQLDLDSSLDICGKLDLCSGNPSYNLMDLIADLDKKEQGA